MVELELEVLSPLHIGNGNTLGLIDFIMREDRFVRVNFDKLADYCYDVDIDLAAGVEDRRFKIRYKTEEIFSIEKFIEFYGIERDYNRFAEYTIPLNIGRRARETKIEVKEYIKDGMGRAYIPGSSVKGAIRTALFWSVLDDEEVKRYCDELMRVKRVKAERACKRLEAKIFGSEAHRDILRALRITDSAPLAEKELEVNEIKIIGNPGPIPTYAECLRTGARTRFEIRVDKNLLIVDIFEDNRLRDGINLDNILRVCRLFSMEYVKKQRSYRHYSGSTMRFYNKLAGMLNGLKETEAILNLGWGGGWYGKTIGLKVENYPWFTANPRDFNRFKRTLRWKLKLGKRGRRFVLNFPKTRRVTIEDMPPGWVKVKVRI